MVMMHEVSTSRIWQNSSGFCSTNKMEKSISTYSYL